MQAKAGVSGDLSLTIAASATPVSTSVTDDVALMEERSQQVYAFAAIHVSALDMTVSYKGSSKMLPNFDELPLKVKALEYTNELWTSEELADQLSWDVRMAIIKTLPSKIGNRFMKAVTRFRTPSKAGQESESMYRPMQTTSTPSGGVAELPASIADRHYFGDRIAGRKPAADATTPGGAADKPQPASGEGDNGGVGVKKAAPGSHFGDRFVRDRK
jgi:hypothetical protein